MKKENKLYVAVDVIEEIFYTVDAKSLIRLKCVCKLWYSLIKDPYFIGRHLKRAKEEADSSSHLIICSEFDYFSTDYFTLRNQLSEVKLHLCSLVGGAPATATATDGNIILTKHVEWPGAVWSCMLPCCNGLICFFNPYCYAPIYIFNPATRESLFLPIPIYDESSRRCRGCAYLGFHPSTTHYKVLVVWRGWKFGDDESQVFTLGGGGSSNSWRVLGKIGYNLFVDSPTCAARGVLYWTAGWGRNWVRSDYIVSFDLGDEIFKQILLPYLDGDRGRSTTRLRLMEVRERVYFVATSYDDIDDTSYEGRINLWVLEIEDSTKKNYSWIKERTIDLVDDIRLFGKLIWFHGDRPEILVIKTRKGIVYYNSRTKQVTDLYEKREREFCFDGCVYIQSLVSLTEWGGSVVLPTGRLCFSDAYEGDMATQEDGVA